MILTCTVFIVKECRQKKSGLWSINRFNSGFLWVELMRPRRKNEWSYLNRNLNFLRLSTQEERLIMSDPVLTHEVLMYNPSSEMFLANPKSPTFATLLESIKTFLAARSRWMHWKESCHSRFYVTQILYQSMLRMSQIFTKSYLWDFFLWVAKLPLFQVLHS